MFEIKMNFVSGGWVLSWALLLLVHSSAASSSKNKEKSADFLSPKFELGPGIAINKFFYDVDFPRGHIALKSFNAEVVDEAGNSVPLYETYLHHWTVSRYYQPKNATGQSGIITVKNSGLCQDYLNYYFGVGAETRGTATHIPDPFGIQVGKPEDIPEGHEERWYINVHAIDTRGVTDRIGCAECRCDLYNATTDRDGNPLSPDYGGGLQCCLDESQCKLRNGYLGTKRKLYLKYTVIWIEWDSLVVPAKIYLFDVTDSVNISSKSKGVSPQHNCKIEYDVKPWNKSHVNGSGYLDVKRTSLPMPTGGYVIYGAGHLHLGGTGSVLYGQDGRVICSSSPTYGTGSKVGNENGYLVGMSTCYPQPGSVKIFDGETITVEMTYNNSVGHTGVMGYMYILVAEQLPQHHV